MMKPICYKCHRFYRPKKNGFFFIEGMPLHNSAKPGTEDFQAWGNYKLWCGDLWQCAGCGHELISGVGLQPLSVHHEKEFEENLSKFQVTYRVNDC